MSNAPIKILLQTTIETTEDDWSIARFGRLAELLSTAVGDNELGLYEVTARDRGPLTAPDPVLSALDQSDFDQLWLFAVDSGDGLRLEDCEGITRFRQRGGGLLVTRDHMDLGSSVCSLGGVGAAHYFHTRNPNPDPSVCVPDDPFTTAISWPNFHSGANGDFQTVEPTFPIHPVLRNAASPDGIIHFLPSHPHEGGIRVPEGANARVIVSGHSKITGRAFDIAVAFEEGPDGGRAIAQSTFHHFADYNWDTRSGCPSFVTEAPGEALRRHPEAWADTRAYVLNLAEWLGSKS
ncbi:hypothetical protein KK137_09780 [Croceibacterium sp. LX-88]|uniref:ThuA-like domain-containing protein n=1 Tax=Croceibacterium selenioxidans TaxID=2838833 RepID=A0ABS5W4J1_9SPHN|nr:hypothetical protein [Croceibacterium selenioxidans]MBT2134624.1 hypothetical protein [Croceibacterium selenioxidans]